MINGKRDVKNMNNYVYEVGENLYINVTNKCSNKCSFCIRNGHDGMNGKNLWLDKEPTAQEIIDSLPEDLTKYKEVVFCGFGEPTYKLDVVCQVGKYVKSKGQRTRINTNGQANLIHGGDITDQLVGAIDVINVSMNASNAGEYQRICNSSFGEVAFVAMLDFAYKCQKRGINVVMSVVDVIGEEEIAACQQLCDNKGLTLRVRKFE